MRINHLRKQSISRLVIRRKLKQTKKERGDRVLNDEKGRVCVRVSGEGMKCVG